MSSIVDQLSIFFLPRADSRDMGTCRGPGNEDTQTTGTQMRMTQSVDLRRGER